MKRAWLSVLCGAALLLGAAPAAQGAFDDPISGFAPLVPPSKMGPPPPPTGYLEGPCGLTVASNGSFYVSDYYHRAVDIFSPTGAYSAQPLVGTGPVNPHTGPVDDPCGLALGPSGTLYVNNYHRNVVRFPSPVSLGSGVVLDSGDPSDSAINPTGVAVDSATGNVYVDDRTYVVAYDSAGAPLPVPKIGLGTLGDGYGIAVSAYPATAGFIYVPDAATNTVKVYDPETDTVNPAHTIAGPPGGFGSLRDSAVAVDRVSGEIYVLDTQGPQFSEQPEATVYVFDAFGIFKGRLKHNVIDGAPSGLAVDNSAGATQGRVYVTSGITAKAGIYAYPKGAATSVGLAPFGANAVLPPPGGGEEPLRPPAKVTTSPSAGRSAVPTASVSEVVQRGDLRIAVTGKLRPRRLPRSGTAPIAVTVGGRITTTDSSLPPQLKAMRIELNRHGRIDNAGLPTCPYPKIQPGSSSRALANCRSALVGRGSFAANITLSGQEPYPTTGTLLVFNGVKGGKPVLYGHIYSARPFATSFVIVFKIQKVKSGTYGSALYAPLPKSMEAWGRLTGLEMTLSRRYAYKGRSHSYLSSGCPAPNGFLGAVFPLARASFSFDGGKKLSSVLTSTCKVRGTG